MREDAEINIGFMDVKVRLIDLYKRVNFQNNET